MKQGNSLPPTPPQRPLPSLRRALVSWVGAGALVAVALFALSGAYLAYQMELVNWHSRLAGESRGLASAINVSLRRLQDPLRWVGQIEPDDTRDRPQILQSLFQDPLLLEIVRLTPEGTVSTSASRDAPALTERSAPSGSDWFQSAAAGMTFVGWLQLSPVEEPDLVVAVPAPDQGIVAGRYDMSALRDIISKTSLGPSAEVMIVTRDGWMVAHSDPRLLPRKLDVLMPVALRDLQATGTVWKEGLVSQDGQTVMAAASPVSGSAWIAVTQIPQRQVWESSLGLLGIMAVNTLVLVILVMLFTRHALIQLVFQPIEMLRRGVERLGLGELGYRLPVRQRDELGVVAETLNIMAERLQERNEQLLLSTRAMRESEARLRRITDNMMDLIAEIDLDDKVIYMSPSHLKILGYSADSLIGKSVYEHLHPEDTSAATRAMNRIKTGAILPPGIFRYRHADGHYLWLEMIANPISDAQGSVVGVVVCGRDITGRRQMETDLRESQARYRAIVDDQTELICRSRPDGTLTFVNGAYCRYFGKTRDELMAASHMLLIPEPDRSIVSTHLATLSLSNPVTTYEHRILLPDGSLRWQQWTDRALFDPDGKIIEYACVGRDITERKLTEVALRKNNEFLSALYKTAMALLEHHEVKEVLQAIVESAASLMDTRDGFLYLQGPSETEIETVVGVGAYSRYIGHRLKKGEGLGGKVWESGQALVVADYDRWEGRSPTFPANELHGALGVPLRSGSQVIGVLGLSHSETGRGFAEDQVDALTGFAQFASIALDNARLYTAAQKELDERKRAQEALARRGEYLNALAQVQRILLVDDGTTNLYEMILPALGCVSDASVARILEIQSDSTGRSHMLERARWVAEGEPSAVGFTAVDECPVRWMQLLKRGEIVDECVSDAPEPERHLFVAQGILSVLVLPLTVEGMLSGVIAFENRKALRPWEKAIIDLLTAASGALAQAIQRRRVQAALVELNQELEQRVVKRTDELARSERYFRSLIENAWDITAIEDAKGVFTYISPSVKRVVGFKPSEVIGQSILSFVHPDDRVQVQELFSRSTADVQAPSEPPLVRVRHKDGSWRTVEAVAMNCLDDTAIGGIVTNIRDVTERTRAEEKLADSERRFRALVENSWDLVALLDATGVIHYASPSAFIVGGYAPEELVGRTAFEFIPPDHAYFVKQVFDSLVQQPGETVTLMTRLRHRDGEYRWADLMAKNMLLDPTVHAIVAHIHDITDRKQAELQAQKRDAQLDALSQMGLAVTMSLDLDVVLKKIAKELMPLLEGAEGISILLREGNELVFAAIEGTGTDSLSGFRMPWDAGVAGAVMRTGQPQRITTEIEEGKIYRDVEGVTGYHTQSLLAVPLKLASETIGVLEAVHRDPRAFSEDDLHLLESAAKWASIAIGNARNFQDLKRRLEEGQALSIIGQALNETLDLENILQLITHAAQEIIPSVQTAVIHLFDEKRQALFPVAATGPVKHDQGTITMRLGEGIAGRVMEQAEAIYVADIQKDPRYLLADGSSASRSLLVAPIQSHGRRSGTISIESAMPDAFSAQDESLLTRLGTLASIAINNAGLYHGEREQRALAEALRETATALGSTLEYDAVLDSILDNVGRVIKYDLAAILLVEQPMRTVKVVRCQASNPQLAETVRDFQMPIAAIPNLQRMLETGNSQVVPDVRSDASWVDIPATRWIASHIGVPIRLRDEIIGFLNLESTTPGFYAEDHTARLQSFAAQAATALGNAKLYRELEDALKQEQATRSQLIQSGKLAALGRMAASVAHEFNNPLQTIKNCLYLLQPQYAQTEDAEFMTIAISETERLSRLVEQLRSAYRPESPQDMRPLPLRSILEQTCTLIMPHLKENRVQYELALPPGELLVIGVADQLKQVFLNIALNAVDAMRPGGGKLTITGRVDPSGQKVAISVADTGRGIPTEDLPHLFDPFFTTKDTGMGLGLAITFDIVQKHNGQIEVTSAPGKGSSFTVCLPLKQV